MRYLHKLATTTVVLLFCLNTNTVLAQSQSDFSFEKGVVALYCTTDGDSEIPVSVFEDAFPQWIEVLQNFANDGVIERAHYLPDFRGGIFIVIGGESLEDAKSKVMTVKKSNLTILEAALQKAGMASPSSDACQQIEIGPVAILPKS